MKILIVEDDSSIRNVLRLSLEAEAFSIDEAEDGEQGSFMARTNDYDLILLDNVLPKKQGGHVCKDIREAGITVPILMLSVKSEVLEKVDLLNTGVDDYMTKPFSFTELLARIRTLMRRPKKLEEKVITIRGIEINRDRGTVSKNKKPIYLTRKEFSLLEYLMKNRDVILSRGQIMEHVWDINANPFSNTIEAHIMSLRKKLRDRNKTFIKSIPGRGYKVSQSIC
ncbi:MAG: two-component system OmpR family response regulator [Candidatus Paceibacteria bacterium]|jgi:two-component system OmpR family response regulator